MDGINVLLEYLSVFKDIELKNENNVQIIKKLDKIIQILENSKNRSKASIEYLTDYNFIEELTKRYDSALVYNELNSKILNAYGLTNEDEVKTSDKVPTHLKDMLNSSKKGIDNVLYDIMLNVNRYNAYYMNKKTRRQDLPLTSDIPFEELDVQLKDVLSYLGIKEDELDKGLVTDLGRYVDLNKFKEMAIAIKTSTDFKFALFDKIQDKNVLVSILLHSSLENIENIGKVFEKYKDKVNKVVAGVPSIFIKDVVGSKCKYDVLTHYNNFMANVSLIQEYNLDFKRMTESPVFLVNDPVKNKQLIERLQSIGVKLNNVLEYVGNILVIKPDVVFKNINTLALYGVNLTDDNNNYGYSLLGMEELDLKLDYLIEQGLWKKSDGIRLDNLDLIRGLVIKDDYLKWKNNFKYDILNNASLEKSEFTNEPFDLAKREMLLEQYPEINDIESKYLVSEEDYYAVGFNVVSRNRILRNFNNFKNKDKSDFKEIFMKSLKYQSNVKNSEEVFSAIMPNLEMGDKSVKLS